ncbi:hypothetical protein [Corynebacterium jeikeium]|uniref:hypothetical protein n=1 Tax=Corynebacterium jeikeium TaxID=38289 RepID=UPI001ED9AA39|nr:hypothetical protein [Corynebacterium jeikeium]
MRAVDMASDGGEILPALMAHDRLVVAVDDPVPATPTRLADALFAGENVLASSLAFVVG